MRWRKVREFAHGEALTLVALPYDMLILSAEIRIQVREDKKSFFAAHDSIFECCSYCTFVINESSRSQACQWTRELRWVHHSLVADRTPTLSNPSPILNSFLIAAVLLPLRSRPLVTAARVLQLGLWSHSGTILSSATRLWIAYQARCGRPYLTVADAHEVRPPGLSPFYATLTLGTEIQRIRAGCAKPHLSLA